MLHSLHTIPDTFGELARYIFKCLPNASVVHFVTDSYRDLSIKGQERLRRGKSDPLIITGPSSKFPRNFQNFLSNVSFESISGWA